MAVKNKFFEIIKNLVGRIVQVRIDFINDNYFFFFNFLIRKSGIKGNIRNQFYCPLIMMAQK